MSDDLPQGRRFSHIYLERGEPRADSVRARHRVSSLFLEINTTSRDGLSGLLERELGIRLPGSAYGVYWDDFFEKCDLRDFLDAITIAYRHFADGRYAGLAATWLRDVGRVLREENLRYRLDAKGGVHFFLDEEFERGRAASVAALQSTRYANVLHAFEQSFIALQAVPPNGKNAVRATFAAAEGLFRLMFNDAPRLTAAEIDKYLTPRLQRLLSGDTTAAGATSKIIASFKDWVDACHFYRHEPGNEEIAQPPLALAVNLVSLGVSYIRWLAELDSRINSE